MRLSRLRNFLQNSRTDERGLTLIEILVVIVLVGLMISVFAKGVLQRGDDAKAQINFAKMEKVKAALQQYKLQYNSYPSSLDGLVRPSGDIKNSGQLFTPLLEDEDLKDVWGQRYSYKTENNNRSFSLTTLGADGVPGGEGAKQDVTIRP